MAAIDTEVGVSGKYEGIGKRFGHTHEAGIGEAHRHIGVFLQQPQHGFRVIVKIEIHERGTALKQGAESRGSDQSMCEYFQTFSPRKSHFPTLAHHFRR